MNKEEMIKTLQDKGVSYEKLSDTGVAYMAGYMEGLIRGRDTDVDGHSPAA